MFMTQMENRIDKITATIQKHACGQRQRDKSKNHQLQFKVAEQWVTIFFSALDRQFRDPAHCTNQYITQVNKRELGF